MLENWLNKKIKNYLENNIEAIIGSVSDETICKLFDKVKNSVIETRHLKENMAALQTENERLKRELDGYKTVKDGAEK